MVNNLVAAGTVEGRMYLALKKLFNRGHEILCLALENNEE